MADGLFVLGVFAVCGGMLWLSRRIEPHFVSRDGRRMLCMSQTVPRQMTDDFGKLRETRCTINADATVTVSTKVLGRRQHGCYRVAGRAAQDDPKKVHYLLRPCQQSADSNDMILRLPSSSKALDDLDSIATGRH